MPDVTDNLSRRLKMRELRILLAVADTGSFHGAARAIHISQPAVTTAIASLEEVLGVRLFERSAQGVQPTTYGATFILRARAIFGELKLALDEISVLASGEQNTLHVGSVPLTASGILPVAVQQLQEQHPGVSVSILEASEQVLAAALRSRRVDLYLARIAPDPDNTVFTRKVLFEDTLCVIANHNHPLATRHELEWKDVVQENWVLPPPGSYFHDHIQRAMSQADLPMPVPAAETLSASVMHGLIAAGQYLGFSTKSVWSFNPLRPLLSRLDLPLSPVVASVGVVTLKESSSGRLAQLLATKVRELASSAK